MLAAPDVVFRVRPVAAFFAVMVAPGTGALLSSNTRPSMLPVSDCAMTNAGTKSRHARTAVTVERRLALICTSNRCAPVRCSPPRAMFRICTVDSKGHAPGCLRGELFWSLDLRRFLAGATALAPDKWIQRDALVLFKQSNGALVLTSRLAMKEIVTAEDVWATPAGGELLASTGAVVTAWALEVAATRGVRIVQGPRSGGGRLVALGADHGGYALKEALNAPLTPLRCSF